MTKEQVLVFPAKAFDVYLPSFSNCVFNDGSVYCMLEELLGAAFYMDRDAAEQDPSFKQVIPYTVIKRGKDQYFVYERTKKGGESRLHNKWSVGVGGHINPVDGDADFDGYRNAFQRELREELEINTLRIEDDFLPRVIGCIYDPSDEVGQVHFGVVHLLRLSEVSQITTKDEALSCGTYCSLSELREKNLENWSRIVVDRLLTP